MIKLDNQISLALESNPPIGPEEISQHIESYQSNPYNSIV